MSSHGSTTTNDTSNNFLIQEKGGAIHLGLIIGVWIIIIVIILLSIIYAIKCLRGSDPYSSDWPLIVRMIPIIAVVFAAAMTIIWIATH